MASTVIHVALLIWSGLFIIAGAMLMIASQIGNLAEVVQAANRANNSIRQPDQPFRVTPAISEARVIAAKDNHLVIPMPHRIFSGGPTLPDRTVTKSAQ